MNTSIEVASQPRRTWLQFSLRTLFMFFTLGACSAWWWQRPYTIEKPSADNSWTTISQFRRSVWGKPVKHGTEKIFSIRPDGLRNLRSTSYWQYGLLHGPYEY